MLLRSSSTPILNSWTPNHAGSSPEPDSLPQLTRTRSVTLMTSFNFEDSPGRSAAARPLPDSDLKDTEPLKKGNGRIKRSGTPKPVKLKEKEKEKKEDEMERLLSSSGLGEGRAAAEEEVCLAVAGKEKRVLQTLVAGGGGSVVGGGRGCSGGGGCNGGDGSGFGPDSYDSNSWHGPDSTDSYYRKMIEANPGNALLLSNYAKFLKEIKGDLATAEEYCGRAILANPTDGTALSLYADLIWQSQRDASRAHTYFDQAVKTDPDDWTILQYHNCNRTLNYLWWSNEPLWSEFRSGGGWGVTGLVTYGWLGYVLASYARFLWDAEEEEEQEEEKSSQYGTERSSTSPMFFGGDSQRPPPLTAAS